jgi:hypothetical protein
MTNAAQISNFLKYMASNIKLESVQPAVNGHTKNEIRAKTRFYPVRRNLEILDTDE